MHIIADYAVKQRGKSTFGLVYDNQYKFGQEGATAFKNSLRRLGKEIGDDCSSRFCGIEAAAKGGYGGQINAFNTSCSQCDYIVFLLQPPTALAWINQGGKVLSGGNMAGPQPLFTRKFAEECKQACNGMWLWTGYIPAIDTNIGKTPIAQFRDDIKATSSSADVTNTFVEGAYIGMNLLKAALERLGPVVTRQGLIAVLNDTQGFDTGLTAKPMSWSRGDHFSNVTMQAYSIRYTDRFAGHLDERVSWDDPWVGSDL
jgi:ABC-type branched-subunit amino acid transport system substrate-binding protein